MGRRVHTRTRWCRRLECAFSGTGQLGETSAKSWQLPAGNFIAAKMPLALVYPRPDSETNTWARHRQAYPGLLYRIPIAVQGGAYPFHFELLDGPPGMTIGETIWDDDYGILEWTPAAVGGPYAVKVRITDQELSFVEAEWQVTATTDGFIFLDPNAETSGDGTIGSPLNAFADVHKDDMNDATYAGHILYLRGGEHTLTGPSNSSGNFRINGAWKPLVWLGYPGESPEVDCTAASVTFLEDAGSGKGGHDFYAQGIAFKNSRPDIDDSRFFFAGGSHGQRMTFFELQFSGLVRGAAGNDNPGAIVLFDAHASDYSRRYLTVMGCSIEDYAAPLVGSIYSTQYAVIENNTLGAGSLSEVNQGIYPKQACDLWSIRRNRSVQQTFVEGALDCTLTGSSTIAGSAARIELCYNTVRSPTSSTSRHIIRYQWTSGTTSNERAVWVYRNTVIGVMSGLSGGPYTVTIEKNLVFNNVTGQLQASDGGRTVVDLDNLKGSYAAAGTYLDGGFALKGEHRDAYLGTHGAEVWA